MPSKPAESRNHPTPPFAIAVVGRALPALVAAAALALLVHVAVQQAHRGGADDPQIQLARDAARALAHGADPRAVAGGPTVDIAASGAVWTSIFDASNRVLASTAALDGRIPSPPSGVLEAARAKGENRISWQPRRGVRSATVSVAVAGASRMVVTVGRSLRQVEVREGQLGTLVAAGWLAASLGSLLAAALGEWLVRR